MSASSFQYPAWVFGVDEAGRGPLFGPVVASCAGGYFESEEQLQTIEHSLLNLKIIDSKKLGPLKCASIAKTFSHPQIRITTSEVDAGEIDRINILNASLLAMELALKKQFPDGVSPSLPVYVWVDGNRAPKTNPALPVQYFPVVKGDQKIPLISLASIFAKFRRDLIMDEYHQQYPEYGFDSHRGYPTKQHLAAILSHGATNEHRKTFQGVL